MNNKQRYGIRKYSIGAASIALGTIAVMGMTSDAEAHASELNGNQAIETSDNNIPTNRETLEGTKVETQLSNVDKSELQNESTSTETSANSNQTNIEKIVEPSAITSNENKPEQIDAPNIVNDALKYKTGMGVNVTNKVNVVTSSITSKDDSNVVHPHNAERVTLKYDWKFPNDLKQGDYFDFTISDNVDTKGISTNRKMPEIKTKDNKDVIAYGEVLSHNNLRYYFTDYVNGKTDLSAQLALNLYFKPSVVLNNGMQEVSSKLGDHIVKNNFDVKYLNGVTDYYGMNINGRMDTLNKDNNSFSHYIYINPTKQNMINVEITGAFVKGKPTGESQPTIKIYKYLNNKALPQSVYSNFNSKDFEDVTKSFDVKINNNGEYSTKFNDLNGETYIIKYEGNYNKADSDLTFRTFLKGVYAQYPYSYRTLTWDNGVQFYSNNASGSGKDKPSEPIYEKGKEIELDYHTSTPIINQAKDPVDVIYEHSKPIYTEYHLETISGDGHYQVIEETEDTVPPVDTIEDTLHGSNHRTGVIEIEEDTNLGQDKTNHISNVIEFEEDTAKGMITGAVSDHTTLEDTMEYITDNHLIEFEDENTLPPSISGQAEGVIEEIEDNHHIDIVDITTPEGKVGHAEGVIDIVEDRHFIDFEEETGNGEIKGEINGTIEEIEDSNVIDMISEIGTDHGSNNMTFEEDTDNDRPSIENGSHDPIEIIEDTIMIENGHTKGVIVEEEKTQPIVPNKPNKKTPELPEAPDTPKSPKEEMPKVEDELKPTPKVKDHVVESPKLKESTPKVVIEKPKFKVINTRPNHVNNDDKAHVTHEKTHKEHHELPRTGSESSQHPILIAGLMSLCGFVLLRRKRDI